MPEVSALLKSRFHWSLLIGSLVLGLMLSTQFRVQQEKVSTGNVRQVQQVIQELDSVRAERESMRTRVQELRDELDQVAADSQQERLRAELERIRIQAGLRSVSGPGIEVVLDDSSTPSQPGQDPNLYILHDEDVLKVLNELRAAGAEALAINGERLVATSEVRCIGPTVLVNKTKRLAPPYTITAIGDPDTMIKALKIRDGVVDTLRFWDIQVTIRRVPEAVVPAYTGPTSFKYARPLLPEGGS